MAIDFHPRPGMVLICNFETGFVPPEMVKPRRVVIVSRGEHNKYGLCTVLPFSTTPPITEQRFHVKFDPGTYPFLHQTLPCSAKCNMINTLSTSRLDRIRVRGRYMSPSLESDDLAKIYEAMLTVFDKWGKNR